MKTTLYTILLLSVMLLQTACVSPKEVVYLQGVNPQGSALKQSYHTLIQKDDLLSISVSCRQPELTAPFAAAEMGSSNGSTDRRQGYLVNSQGNIVLPVIGAIRAAGKSCSQLGRDIAAALKNADYIQDASVNVRILNFKFSVLGEVNNPGVHSVEGERVTILEAISQAGDLTIDGNREVMLVRETDGKREVARLDLRSKDIFRSPYYYIRQNDVIYVSPSDRKINTRSDAAQWYSWGISGVSIILAIIALACC